MHKSIIIIKSCASCVPLCQVLKVCIPDYVQVPRRHRETGDKSSLRCRFHSNTYSTVVKASKWKFIYLKYMKSKCAWHLFGYFLHGVPELCSFFKIVKSIYMYIYCDSIITQSGSTGKKHVITDRVIYMRSLFKIFNATSFTGFHIRKKMSHPVSFGMEHQSVYLVLWL